jgi:hypothetical protein
MTRKAYIIALGAQRSAAVSLAHPARPARVSELATVERRDARAHRRVES